MSGEISFVPTQTDWVAANRLWHRKAGSRRWLRWLGIVVVALAVIDIVMQVWANNQTLADAIDDALIMLICGAVFLSAPLLNALLLPRQVRRMFKQRPSMADETSYRWDERGLHGTTRTGTTHQPWGELYRQLRDDRSFVFLMSDRLMLLIPRRVLTEQQATDLASTADEFGPPMR